MAVVTVRLPDGSTKELEEGTTAYQFAEGIGRRLAKAAIAARFDGVDVDLATAVPDGAEVTVVTEDSDAGRAVIRHSTAHVLAQAVLRLWPGAHYAIGPVIEDGFYYDFELPGGAHFSDDDLDRIEATMRVLSSFRRQVLLRDDEFLLATTPDDVLAAQRSGRLAVGFDLEDTNPLGGEIAMIQAYYDLGVRWMLFAYNRNNELAGGYQDEDHGLTPFGVEVLEEMERVGMLVCCSHIGARSAMEILERARRPVIFSHSNPRALRDHPRNIGDEGGEPSLFHTTGPRIDQER